VGLHSNFVFIDRDGVLNVDSPDYIKRWQEFEFYPDALEALRWLHQHNIHTILISNQSGLNRGLIKVEDFWELHHQMLSSIQKSGGELLAALYCPHCPDENCSCRKPSPQMIVSAARLYQIPLERAYMIGDRAKDMEAATQAGCRGILIDRSQDRQLLKDDYNFPENIITFESLMDAVMALSFNPQESTVHSTEVNLKGGYTVASKVTPYFQPKTPVEEQGISNYTRVFYNPTAPELYEQAIRRQEGLLAHMGPLVVRTGHFTGRAPNDKFIVKEAGSSDKIWWSEVNRPFDQHDFEKLHQRLLAYLQGREIYVQDSYVGADPEYRLPVRIITEKAWQSLFARNMFLRILDPEVLSQFVPEYTVIAAPHFHASPELHHTNSEAFILLHFEQKMVLIGGTGYGGEIKKSIFTVMNYLLPQKGVLPMHCSANVGKDGTSAIFFGLSGTGKTSLSADPDRQLVGDDEHGWSDNGIFNFEGGCYAKVIRLSPEAEPQIYQCTRRFGTVLENVAIDVHLRRIDLDDPSLTENTRAAYALSMIENASSTGMAPHPRNIIMLTCDAFGVLPPISKLTPDQAMYHFLAGYTAKVAGTETGIVEPQATFSTCFGAPFMALPPSVYAGLLGERIQKHQSTCWLINTGWTGGEYGTGHRIQIDYSRKMVNAALNGALADTEFVVEPYFGLSIPKACPGIESDILNPLNTWKDKEAYKHKAADLRNRFKTCFKRFEKDVDPRLRDVL